MTQELIYHLSAYARVTNIRAIFGSNTYPISSVSSTAMLERPASPRLGYAILACAVLIALGSIAAGMLGGSAIDGMAPGLIVALVMGSIGAYALMRARPTYAIRLWTLDGEVEVLSSPDQRHVAEVLAALNKAIERRE